MNFGDPRDINNPGSYMNYRAAHEKPGTSKPAGCGCLTSIMALIGVVACL